MNDYEGGWRAAVGAVTMVRDTCRVGTKSREAIDVVLADLEKMARLPHRRPAVDLDALGQRLYEVYQLWMCRSCACEFDADRRPKDPGLHSLHGPPYPFESLLPDVRAAWRAVAVVASEIT